MSHEGGVALCFPPHSMLHLGLRWQSAAAASPSPQLAGFNTAGAHPWTIAPWSPFKICLGDFVAWVVQEQACCRSALQRT